MLANEGHDNWITVTVLMSRCASDIVMEHGGISMTQYRILLRLKGNNDERTVKELASDLGISPSTATSAINELERRKAIVRQYDEDDGRVVHVVLADVGSQLIEQVDPAICELAHDWWSVYSEEELAMTRRDSSNTVLERRLAYMKDDALSIENAYVDSALVSMSALGHHMRRENISLNEYRILHLLSVNPAGMRPKELSRELLLRSNEVTVAASKLVEHGRVERVRMEGDRRAAVLRILDAGYSKLEHMTPQILETFRTGITELSDNAFENYDSIARKILDRYRRSKLLF